MKTRYEQMTSGALDSYANFSGDDSEYRDWLGVIGQHRDSDALARSNFATAVAMLDEVDPAGDDHRVESFGHWGVGWIEEVYVRPGSKAADIAAEIESALADYPVLNEQDYCERETEEANETWTNCYTEHERLDYIRRNRSQFEFHGLADLRACVRGEFFNGYASELLA